MDNFDSPGSRTEAILQNMLGADNPLDSPKSRVEEILQSSLDGEEITTEPQSRVEELLIEVLNNGGGGGGGGNEGYTKFTEGAPAEIIDDNVTKVAA